MRSRTPRVRLLARQPAARRQRSCSIKAEAPFRGFPTSRRWTIMGEGTCATKPRPALVDPPGATGSLLAAQFLGAGVVLSAQLGA